MNDPASTEVGRPQRKIARTEWAAIAARNANGESLASIARDYLCTAPAIRYIVRQAVRSGLERNGTKADQAATFRRGAISTRAAGALSHPAKGPSLAASESDASGVGRVAGRTTADGIDLSLRDSIMVELSAFLVAFEAVASNPGRDDLDRLRNATDRLLRAAARVRIELERVRRPAAPV